MTGRRLVLSGAGLLALLAVVAVASRAYKPGGGRSGGGAKVPPVLLEYLGVLALVVILVGGAVAVFALADNRRRRAIAGQTGWRRSLGGVAFAMLALLAALLLSRHVHRHNAAPLFGAFGPTGVAKGVTGSAAERAAHQQQTESDWLGAVILGSILIGLAAAIASAAAKPRSPRRSTPSSPTRSRISMPSATRARPSSMPTAAWSRPLRPTGSRGRKRRRRSSTSSARSTA